jgi:hypothetical protein
VQVGRRSAIARRGCRVRCCDYRDGARRKLLMFR